MWRMWFKISRDGNVGTDVAGLFMVIFKTKANMLSRKLTSRWGF